MSPTYFTSLTGANCTVGGQSIISLNVTEDIDADYATAAAVCLAPGGPHTRGEVVATVEGGVSTGYWVVEDATRMYSGQKTWRRKGGAGYAHVPLVSYRLKRKGYLAARGTLSKSTLGASNYPPKFCTMTRLGEIATDLDARMAKGEIDIFARRIEYGSWHPVSGPNDIISAMCNWVGLPFQFRTNLTGCADEYLPVSKPLMSACKEVASWSGASCYLDRNGVLQIYDWDTVYGGGGSLVHPPSVLELEQHETLYPINQCTVIGKGSVGNVISHPAMPARERPGWKERGIDQWRPATGPVTYLVGHTDRAVEVTESLGLVSGEKIVESRVEINNYRINPALAQSIARDQLARAFLQSWIAVFRGPAEGCQAYAPLTHNVFTVNRTLNWNGSAYRYEIELTEPQMGLSWGAPVSSTGWW